MKKYIVILSVIILALSCRKDTDHRIPLTSLTVVNAVNGGGSAKLGKYSTTILSNGSANFVLPPGDNDIYIWPITDSTKPYYNQPKLALQKDSIQTLFLCGTPSAGEGLFLKETLPYYTDSVAGIRFINLAPNSTPVNITINTAPGVNQVAGLAYKQYTDFKQFPAKFNTAYTVEVRSAANPTTIVASLTFTATTVPRFTNLTLVIRQNGTGLAILRVNHDR